MTRLMRLMPDVDAAVAEAAAVLRRPGTVVLVPTETVYGLVCRASDEAARKRIYELKHREASKPLALFTADWRKLDGVRLEGLPAALAEKYCPGPITIIAPGVDGGTVGFRIPDHPFILSLLKLYGRALASTSANRSGQPPALEVGYALETLAEQPDFTVDGGALPKDSIASTVVLVNSDNSYKILREGLITQSMIENTLKQN